MSDLIGKKDVLNIIDSEMELQCGYQVDIACRSLKKSIAELPTVSEKEIRDNVIGELIQKVKEVYAFTILEEEQLGEIAEQMKEVGE